MTFCNAATAAFGLTQDMRTDASFGKDAPFRQRTLAGLAQRIERCILLNAPVHAVNLILIRDETLPAIRADGPARQLDDSCRAAKYAGNVLRVLQVILRKVHSLRPQED